MKITILSNRDLASCVALNHLLPMLSGHSLRIFLSSRVGKKNGPKGPEALDTLKFVEQDLFNLLMFPLIDRSEQRSADGFLSFKGLERYLDAPIDELNDINGEGLLKYAETDPDLVLSIRYGVILRDAAIAVPKQGVLNLHSGRLPNYKGVMATFRALLHGDSELNMTLHTIDDSGIDTGKIIAYSSFPVDLNKSYLWHVLGLYEGGCRLMATTAQKILSGDSVQGVEQSSLAEQGEYFTFPTVDELRKFTDLGFRLVDSDELADMAGMFMRED